MFKLNRLTDYAVVIMSQMALTPGAIRNAAELARETAVPQPTVAKILGILTKSELVSAHRGAAGGYSLASAPDEIPVSDIIGRPVSTSSEFNRVSLRLVVYRKQEECEGY